MSRPSIAWQAVGTSGLMFLNAPGVKWGGRSFASRDVVTVPLGASLGGACVDMTRDEYRHYQQGFWKPTIKELLARSRPIGGAGGEASPVNVTNRGVHRDMASDSTQPPALPFLQVPTP